ncbi:MAG TPA: CsgG/HfaB family protein, partial [Candidatus Obscuribacterales bacterium]
MPYRLLLCLLLLVSPLAHPSIMPAVLAAEQAQTKGIRLVIMPFKNLTRVADDDWLSDSFAESLTMGLIKVEALQLVERSQLQNLLKEQAFSQSAYVDESTAPRLGQMLGANVVVLGSFQKVGDQLQANVRFVDVETGKIDGKRAAQVQGQFNAIFDLQKQLATELISQLNIQARPAELAELEKTVKATDSPEANRLYLEGLKYLRLGDSQFLDKARDAFREALEIDADYALALAGLAEVHTRKVRDLGQLRVLPPNMDFSVRGPDDAALARKYADKALALQPELPQVLRALAWLEQVEGHRPQALELIRRAIRKDPRDSDSIVAYVSFRFENSDIALGAKQVRQELGSLGANLDDPWVQYTVAALATGQEATKPRPQMGWIRELLEQAQTKLPDYPLIPITLATVAQSEGKPEESLRHLRRAYELGKDSPDVLGYLATIYLGQSDPQTAFRLVQEAEAIKPDHLYIQMTKAQALFALGRKAESDALYEQLERRSPDNVMIS